METEKKYTAKPVMPIIAVVLDILPVLIIIISRRFPMSALIFLFTLLMPIAGMVLGIVCLYLGKQRMGKAGIILAFIAVGLPLSFIAFILIFFIGASTGLIRLM